MFSGALILIVSLGWVILAGCEFYNVAILQEAEDYPFGSEGPVAGAWQYENKVNYTIFISIQIIMCVFLILLAAIGLVRKNVFIVKFAMIMFSVSFVLLHIIQGNYFAIW